MGQWPLEGQSTRPRESKDIRCKTDFCGMLEAGISKGTIQNLNPERITGVMMKVMMKEDIRGSFTWMSRA